MRDRTCPVCGFTGLYCGCAEVEDNGKSVWDKEVQGTIKQLKFYGGIHYCPFCSVHNPAWVRQKKMPLKCRNCKSEWTMNDIDQGEI